VTAVTRRLVGSERGNEKQDTECEVHSFLIVCGRNDIAVTLAKKSGDFVVSCQLPVASSVSLTSDN
jgi:hypothetical protein